MYNSPEDTNLECFNKPGTVRLQPVMLDSRNAEKLGVIFVKTA